MTLTISKTGFYRFQFGIVTALVILGVGHYATFIVFGKGFIAGSTSIFDLGREDSITTAFASMNLLVASTLLFCLYRHSKSCGEPRAFYWLILGILFFAMAIEETAGIHERANKLQQYTGQIMPVDEFYSWLPYGIIVVIICFVFFLPFVAQLERRTATLIFLSGAIFVGGALGFEFINGWMLYNGYVERNQVTYFITRLFEESFEVYGIALFNCTLFALGANKGMGLTIIADP